MSSQSTLERDGENMKKNVSKARDYFTKFSPELFPGHEILSTFADWQNIWDCWPDFKLCQIVSDRLNATTRHWAW